MSQSFETLLAWFEANGIWWDTKAIDIVQVSEEDGSVQSANQLLHNDPSSASNQPSPIPDQLVSPGMGIVARKDLELDDVVVRIPKSAVLSAKSGGIANILEDEELGGGIALTLSTIFEMARGIDSPWYGYLQSLPTVTYIPILWSDEEKEWLAGTDLAKDMASDQTELDKDYRELVAPVLGKYPDIFAPAAAYTFERFLQVTSVVTSRAFQVDNYHGDALVPFADIFNHRTGGEHVHIEAQGEVCDACGEHNGCEHTMDQSEGEDAEGTGEEDEGGPEEEAPELEGADGGSDAESFESEDEDAMDMCVFRPVSRGNEVFNTYGEHGASYILHRYGFAEADNPFDCVTLELEVVARVLAQPAHAVLTHGRGGTAAQVYLKLHSVFRLSEPVTAHVERSRAERDSTLNYFPVTYNGSVDNRLLLVLTLLLHTDEQFNMLTTDPKMAKRYFVALRGRLDQLDSGTSAPSTRARTEQRKSSKLSRGRRGGLVGSRVEDHVVQQASEIAKRHPEVLQRVFSVVLELLGQRMAQYPVDPILTAAAELSTWNTNTD
ncbi:hypothetical protein H4R33_001770 [Dimargaris cristalligena]|uniref:Uncharacterized protein n=1 Tax=Dimargaris cristalligena TaxID=215637 RepID=A0A4Q0A0K9_9FUNG|nr:hypothetical protein H4R33_001770 [Dimargaris cristalligena]RKP38961.1 hypothetical protein BJ085DRAFT_38516 [Dimargaris cristalligena]|eukprot:RKP38961.1 hypothetical protein BJ085DRAFT_38516 [Dimargaris cristalligena]